MKVKSLHFGKAMSAALFVLLLSVAGLKNALAQNQVATLQHNDSITGVFYGQNALISAYDAAADWDIITLSSGDFYFSNNYGNLPMTKTITIRGAGCVYDSVTQVTPTIISSNIIVRGYHITFEGILFTGTVNNQYSSDYASFVKCNINKIATFYSGSRMNWNFTNCIIKDFCPSSGSNFHGMSIINSVIRFTQYYHSDVYNPTAIYNSVVLFDNERTINNIVAYNSIIATVSGHTVSNCTFFNCIGIETGETLLFEGQIAQNVMEVDSYEDVFETFDGTITYDNIYQLKNEIATSFLGQDGTEVGIYGGMMPYNPRPTYMKIRHCNVAPRSTIDNKLSVDIEVLTGDE